MCPPVPVFQQTINKSISFYQFLFNFCVFLCTWGGMHGVGLHVDGYICMHMCMGVVRLMSGITYYSSTLLTESGSHSPNQSSLIRLVWVASWLWGSKAGLAAGPPRPLVFTGDPNLGPHTFAASASPTGSAPRTISSLNFVLFILYVCVHTSGNNLEGLFLSFPHGN